MKLVSRAILALLGGFASPVHAQSPPPSTAFERASSLSSMCNEKGPPFDMMCAEYIMGVHDAIATVRLFGFLKPEQMAYCLPASATPAQMMAAVRLHLLSNPTSAASEVMGPLVVLTALAKAFPCK